MKTIQYLMCALATVICAPLAAHGPGCSCCQHGHDVAAPHGGMVEHAENTGLVVELLANDDHVRVYVFEHDMSPVPMNAVAVKATMQLSRRFGGNQEMLLREEKGALVSDIKIPERAHYYKVQLQIDHEGMSDEVVFTVEP